MRSHTLRLLLVSVLLPLAGCGSLKKVEEQVVKPVQQPVKAKKAPVKQAAPAKAVTVAPKVVKKPVVPATPASERSEKSDSGGDSGSPW